MIRVVIAEDQAMIREAFRGLIDAQADMTVVGAVGDGQAAVAAAHRLRPEVVLMDIRMPGVDGIAATRQIAGTASAVLVLTTFREESLVLSAIDAGAAGFLLKDSAPPVLLDAIRRITAGEGFLDPVVTPLVLRHVGAHPAAPATPPAVPVPAFTARENDVFALVCKGLSNREIAARLVVAETTVKSHVKSLLQKTGTADRVGLVLWAARHGLL